MQHPRCRRPAPWPRGWFCNPRPEGVVPVGPEGEAHSAPPCNEEDGPPRQLLPRCNGRCHCAGSRWGAGATTAPTQEDTQQEGGSPEAEEHREEDVALLTGRLPCPDHHSVGHSPLWCEFGVWPLSQNGTRPDSSTKLLPHVSFDKFVFSRQVATRNPSHPPFRISSSAFCIVGRNVAGSVMDKMKKHHLPQPDPASACQLTCVQLYSLPPASDAEVDDELEDSDELVGWLNSGKHLKHFCFRGMRSASGFGIQV